MNNTISFGAKFVQKLPIRKYSYEKKDYIQDYANLVELDVHDKKDIRALDDIAIDFGGDSYVNNMCAYVKQIARTEKNKINKNIFVLTRQEDNFENLKTLGVLGVAETSKMGDKTIELEYLQVHPMYVYARPPRSVKGIGSAIVKYLQLVNDKITLIATSSAFYKKCGFKKVSPNGNRMLWEKNKDN